MRRHDQIIVVTSPCADATPSAGHSKAAPVTMHLTGIAFHSRGGHVHHAGAIGRIDGHQVITDAEHQLIAFRVDDLAIAVEPSRIAFAQGDQLRIETDQIAAYAKRGSNPAS